MACPIAAGIIAQWLEAVPTLTREQVIEAFKATCRRHDPSLVYPNNDYGYGEIDAEAGLMYLLEHPDGIASPKPSPEGEDLKSHPSGGDLEEAYDLNGRKLSNRQMFQGIKITKGKKFLR